MYGFSDSNTGSSASAYIDMSTGTLTLNSSKADCLHILSEDHVVVPSGTILRDSLSLRNFEYRMGRQHFLPRSEKLASSSILNLRLSCLFEDLEKSIMADIITQNAVYSKLDKTSNTIRLIDLLSALHSDGRLQCDMNIVSLDNSPSYEALSYMWGEADLQPHAIWVNGRLVNVRQNLEHALIALQKRPGSPRYLWVDALCINQENIEERNHQVGLMGNIYRCAEVVLVWLGDNDLISHFNKLTAETESCYHPDILRYISNRNLYSIHGFLVKEDVWAHFSTRGNDYAWNSRAYVSSLPYWQRLWIVQEICLATEIQLFYGDSTCSWNDFFSVIEHVNIDDPSWPHLPFSVEKHKAADLISQSAARRLALARGRGNSSQKLWTLINLFKNSQCQDPRDKVYSLLSLSNDIKDGEIEVDYSKSLFEVWEDVVQYYVNHNYSHHSVVEAAEFLQRLFIGSPSKSEDPFAMGISVRSAWTQKCVPIGGNIQGRLKLSNVNPSNLFLFKDGSVRAPDYQQSDEGQAGRETRHIVLGWQSSLRELWNFDHKAITFPQPHMQATNGTAKEALVGSLVLFKVQQHEDLPCTT